MRNTFRNYGKNRIDKQKKRRAVKIVTAISALLVAGLVMWQMMLPGIAMHNKTYCGKEEHTHTDACYTEQLTCGQEETEEHHHTDACYTKTLTCGKEEHIHTDACYSNPDADVENEDTWKSTFANVQLGDEWGNNVVSIAETQIGYQESEKNYIVTENNEHKGYTRYGQWAGNEYIYSNWDTTFAEFCIHYAEIPDTAFPMNVDINEWIKELQDNELYVDSDLEGYQPGDLIFFQKNQETEKQVGIIDKIEDKDGKTYISVIEGNFENQVKRSEYAADDENILGYGLISRAQMKYQASQIGDETENTTGENEIESVQQEAKEQTASNSENASRDTATVQEEETGKSVDQRIKVDLSASPDKTTTGHTISAKIVSTYSQANTSESSAHVCLKVGTLPEGISIEGFKDGVHVVNYLGQDIVLTLTEENGEYYISYDQPAGSTLEFDVQFSSKNGVMPAESQVTISVDKDRTKAPEGTEGVDSLDDSQTLTWTAKNEWDPVDKKVNGNDSAQTKIDGENLTGTFKYTIQANSSNGENYGEIWTDYIDVTDIFTPCHHRSN